MTAEYLIATIRNSILVLGFGSLAFYFTLKYLGSYLERSKKQQEQKHKLELYEKIGKMTNEGINLEEVMKKSLSITEAIEKDIAPPKETKNKYS